MLSGILSAGLMRAGAEALRLCAPTLGLGARGGQELAKPRRSSAFFFSWLRLCSLLNYHLLKRLLFLREPKEMIIASIFLSPGTQSYTYP